MTSLETLNHLLNQVQSLEYASRHHDAIAVCEAEFDGLAVPEIQLALARNRYALAAGGKEEFAIPSLMAALAGIQMRCQHQPDVADAIGICRWVAERVVPAPLPRPASTDPGVLAQIQELETAGKHTEAITLCEKAIHTDSSPEVHLALARNHYALASQGNEFHAWPALLAALDGIEKRSRDQPDSVFAVGICRWVLDFFADPHRADIRGAGLRLKQPLTEKSIPWEMPPQSIDEHKDITSLDDLTALFHAGHHVRVGNALLAAATSSIRYGRDANWVSREVRYLMANVLSPVTGQRCSGLLSGQEYPIPGDYEAQLYDRYLFSAAQVERSRILARARGVPGILITSLPKSASEFLSYTLAEALQAPVVRVTIGDPFLGSVYEKWVANVRDGGCVTHDHFSATELNLRALAFDAPSDGVWVLVRDPRSVFWSLQNMESEYDGVPVATRMSRATTPSLVKRLADWIHSWIQAEKEGCPVRFIHFRELTSNPAEVMETILQAESAERFIPQLQYRIIHRKQNRQVSNNFRKGDEEAWREGIPIDWHSAIWDVIPESVRQLLALHQ